MPAPSAPVILIAEDDPEILAMLATRLARRSSRVIEVQDGDTAIAEAEKHRPDLVLLDVMLPGKTGWEVCRHLRRSEATRDAAIIIVTAIGEQLNEMTAGLYGADAHVNKPFEFTELDRQIDAALAARGKLNARHLDA
jgi:DNA-binding response OmpR family regulator